MTEKAAQASLSDAWDKTLLDYIERHRLKTSAFVYGGLATAAALLVGMLFLTGGLWGVPIVLTLVAGGIAALVIWNKKKKADAAVAKATAEREAAKAASIEVYREATAEYVDWRLTYEEEDAREAEVLTLVDQWPAYAPDGKERAK